MYVDIYIQIQKKTKWLCCSCVTGLPFHPQEEALRAFVSPEVLTGNNQYKCATCDALCDAHKGLKFTRFPYLLTIHLMRFDFDYQTLHRIKLNDKWVCVCVCVCVYMYVCMCVLRTRTTCARRVEWFRDDKRGSWSSKWDENRKSCLYGWMCCRMFEKWQSDL